MKYCCEEQKLTEVEKMEEVKITANCDMCHLPLICKEHHSPMRFDPTELERLRKTHFIHCEKCYLVKRHLFENMLKEIKRIPPDPLSWKEKPEIHGLEWHVKNAVDGVSLRYPDLECGECLNHSAKTFPKETK